MWKSLREHTIRRHRLSAIALGMAGAVVAMQFTGILQLLEWAVLDQWFRLRPPEDGESRAVVVTIDEADIANLGVWPISDLTLATLIEKLKQHQPRAIGLDLYRDLPVEPGRKSLLKVFETTPNLFAIEKVVSGKNGRAISKPAGLQGRSQVGASDLVQDSDGKLRRNLLSVRIEKPAAQPTALTKYTPQTTDALGVKLALAYLKVEGISPRSSADRRSLQLGKAHLQPLRTNEGGYVRADIGGFQILSNFYRFKSGTPTISITAVLQDRVPANLIRDRVVVVGSIAESVSDRFYTPFSTDTQSTWSGVELHANIANQLIGAAIDGRTLLKGIPEPLELGWVLLWSAVGAALGAQLNSARWTAWVSLGAALCLTGLAYGCFLLGWWVLAVAPMLALLGSALLSRGAMLWSDLRLSHQVLEGYSKTLEVKVRQRTQELRDKNTALEQAKQQAEAASRAKSTFLANMNHELRTPLAIILGCSEILGYDQSLSARQRERLSTIDDSVQHLLKLINDVLEVSKIEAGVVWVDRKTVDLSKLLKSLEEMFRSQAALKGVALWFELAPNLPEHIQTDENKLRQILINLLSNAVKFTEQGHVILRVRVAEPRSLPTSTIVPCQSLHFEVEDTGYGIAPDELDTLFDAFVQAEAGRTSKQGGTGLGLSISQQFVKLLGGEIRVHSAAGQGSLFGFEIEI